MELQLSHRGYRRKFRHPLVTAHGKWAVREGFILRFEQGGQVGYAEVAPLPDFGTETVAEAGALLARLAADPNLEIPETHPCCAFARSLARGRFDYSAGASGGARRSVAALVPAGPAALLVSKKKLAQGYRTLKWKIGVWPLEVEVALAAELLAGMPAGAKLRLDANAGLTAEALDRWLPVLAEAGERVEFLEQPLPPGAEAEMAARSRAAGVAIALDESLNGRAGRKWLEPGAWAGPLVIKPLLMGPLPELVERLLPVAGQLVLSSVFETGVGVHNMLLLAGQLPESPYALGFDTREAFDDVLSLPGAGPRLLAVPIVGEDLERLWKELDGTQRTL